MNVNRIMLLGQSSERDLIQDSQEGAENNINFNFGLNPSDDKPWPYELTLHSEITLKKGDSEKNLFPFSCPICDMRFNSIRPLMMRIPRRLFPLHGLTCGKSLLNNCSRMIYLRCQ